MNGSPREPQPGDIWLLIISVIILMATLIIVFATGVRA